MGETRLFGYRGVGLLRRNGAYIEVAVLFFLVVSLSIALSLWIQQRERLRVFPHARDFLGLMFKTDIARVAFFSYLRIYPNDLPHLKYFIEKTVSPYGIKLKDLFPLKRVQKRDTKYFLVSDFGILNRDDGPHIWRLWGAIFEIKGRYYRITYNVIGRAVQ